MAVIYFSNIRAGELQWWKDVFFACLRKYLVLAAVSTELIKRTALSLSREKMVLYALVKAGTLI